MALNEQPSSVSLPPAPLSSTAYVRASYREQLQNDFGNARPSLPIVAAAFAGLVAFSLIIQGWSLWLQCLDQPAITRWLVYLPSILAFAGIALLCRNLLGVLVLMSAVRSVAFHYLHYQFPMAWIDWFVAGLYALFCCFLWRSKDVPIVALKWRCLGAASASLFFLFFEWRESSPGLRLMQRSSMELNSPTKILLSPPSPPTGWLRRRF